MKRVNDFRRSQRLSGKKRLVQTAAKLVLEPIFEADFEDNAYGYRPARGAVDAVKEVHRLICRSYTDVVDADLSRYFDTITHSDLMKSVARRIVDRHVPRLSNGSRRRSVDCWCPATPIRGMKCATH